MQECSSSAQMNHRVEVWFLFVVLIDWIMKLRISCQPETCDLHLDNEFHPNSIYLVCAVQLVLGSSEFVCSFPEIGLNKV